MVNLQRQYEYEKNERSLMNGKKGFSYYTPDYVHWLEDKARLIESTNKKINIAK